MTRAEKIAKLEAISRTRALNNRESHQLEDWLRREGLVPLSSTADQCIRGHDMVGENVVIDRNQRRCRECRREDGRRSKARAVERAIAAGLPDGATGVWKVDELRKLRVAYEMGWTDAQIGEHLGRTASSIKTTRARYKICARPTCPSVERADPGMMRERVRGEKLLDRAFGGKPKRDTTPMTRQWMPPHVATQTIGASSSSWAVA